MELGRLAMYVELTGKNPKDLNNAVKHFQFNLVKLFNIISETVIHVKLYSN